MLFAASGATALTYQLIWVRMLSDVFGVTVLAVTTVVTAFMAGLALGSLVFGRLVDRYGRPLLVFAGLQLVVGLFALAWPELLRYLTEAYVALYRRFPTSFYVQGLIRFGLTFGLLLVPTTLMGGTLPVLTKYFVRALRHMGRDLGQLYGVNNLGAVVGIVLTAFLLIRSVGMQATLWIAAGINIAAAGVLLALHRFASAQQAAAQGGQEKAEPYTPSVAVPGAPPARYPAYVRKAVLWAFAIEGFCALAYEVLWTRMLVGVSQHKDVYLFSTILAGFILGLSLGSYLIGRICERRRDVLLMFGAVELAIGLVAVAAIYAFQALPETLWQLWQWADYAWWSGALENVVLLLVLLVPTTLMGATFPLVGRICTQSVRQVGRSVGQIGCLDTVGSIFGAFAAGFVLVPVLGVTRAVGLTAVINILIGAGLLFAYPGVSRRFRATMAFSGVGLTVALLLLVPARFGADHWLAHRRYDSYLYLEEGVSATVGVPAASDGEKGLMIDGMVTAATNYDDMRVHAMLGYVPFLAHPQPRKALVIGFGMGVTSGCLLQDGIERVDCVELAPEVLEAASCFADVNGDVMNDPRFRAVLDDGRSYLLATGQRYDLITSNAVHARLSNGLYTVGFYRLCRDRLTEDGTMAQWLPSNWMTRAEYWMLVRAFAEVFPHTSIWEANIGHQVLLGTLSPGRLNYPRLAKRLARPKPQADLGPLDLSDPVEFLAHFVAGGDELRAYTRHLPLNTDDCPRVEFSFVADRRPIAGVIRDLVAFREQSEPDFVDWGTAEHADELQARLERYRHAFDLCLRARIRDTQGRDEAVLAVAAQARSVAPKSGRIRQLVYSLLGSQIARAGSLRAEGKLRQAAQLCQRVLELDPGSPSAFVELALIHQAAGNLPRAVAAARQAVESEPGFGRAHAILGMLLVRTGDTANARKHLESAIQMSRSPDPLPYLWLGRLHARQGRLVEAARALGAAVNIAPNVSRLHLELAEVLERLDESEAARRHASEALRLAPASKQAQDLLRRLSGQP